MIERDVILLLIDMFWQFNWYPNIIAWSVTDRQYMVNVIWNGFVPYLHIMQFQISCYASLICSSSKSFLYQFINPLPIVNFEKQCNFNSYAMLIWYRLWHNKWIYVQMIATYGRREWFYNDNDFSSTSCTSH